MTYKELITPENIQGELIKNEIEQNNLKLQAFKEQKFNELLKENQQLKDIINKAIEYIEKQKRKMYKSRNKIAMFILIKLLEILKETEVE